MISPSELEEVATLQSVPSHATPTSDPSLQSVNKCHRPAPSLPPLLPLHCENADSREFKESAELEEPLVEDEGQAVFHGRLEDAVLGQLPLTTWNSTAPRETLKVR